MNDIPRDVQKMAEEAQRLATAAVRDIETIQRQENRQPVPMPPPAYIGADEVPDIRELIRDLLVNSGTAATPKKSTKSKPATVKEKMAALVQEDPDRINWTAQQFADKLGCTATAVKQTPTWTKTIRQGRALSKRAAVERAQRPDRQ